MSAIRLEKNGRNSCTGNSRHVDIRYFFVKDRVDSGNIKILYCPTEEMLADFFTKCLQGSLFRKFRDIVMGYTSIDDFKNKSLDKSTNKQGFSKVKEHVDILENTRKVTYENVERKKGKNETSKRKRENSKTMNVSHSEISPLTTVRSTVGPKSTVVGPRSTVVGPRSELGTKNGSSGRMETYAEVLKYGKVKKNT